MSWNKQLQRQGGAFISVDLDNLAANVARKLSSQQQTRVVGVGASGAGFAEMIRSGAPRIAITTENFATAREQRQLRAEATATAYQCILVDDIAVSGLTLAVAAKAVTPQPAEAAVGMLFNSRSTMKRIGLATVQAGMVYSREGGGNPPINSLETLVRVPERLESLAAKYFKSSLLFTGIIQGVRI